MPNHPFFVRDLTSQINPKMRAAGLMLVLIIFGIIAGTASAGTSPQDALVQISTSTNEMPRDGVVTIVISVTNPTDANITGYINLPDDNREFAMYGQSNHHLARPLKGGPGMITRIWNVKLPPGKTATLTYPIKLDLVGINANFDVWWYNNHTPYQGLHISRLWGDK